MRVKVVLLVVALAAFLVLGLAGIYAYYWRQDALRIQDAAPAFDPLEQLNPVLLSQPFGERYCRYVLDFPPDSLLTDDNIGLLRSLNRLPEQNTLDVTVRTTRVTDASVSTLASLRSVDLLDVSDTAITDDGVAQLQALMSNERVVVRRPSNVSRWQHR